MSAERDRTSSLLLAAKIVLLVAFVASTNRLFLERLSDLQSANNYFAIVVYLGIWAIAMLSLAITAWLPRPWLRIGWAIPIAVSTFFGDLAYGVASAHLTFYDVVLYWSERPHWIDATVAYAPSFAAPLIRAGVGVLAVEAGLETRCHGCFPSFLCFYLHFG